MREFKSIFFPLTAIILAACASVQKEKPSAKLGYLNLIDQTIELGLFSDAIIGGGNVFNEVEDHSSSYNFDCYGNQYTIQFLTYHNQDKTISTQIESLRKAAQRIKSRRLADINKKISYAELVGPVGLRCSSNSNDEKIRLTLNLASVDPDRSVYKFSNEDFVLGPDDFE